MPEQSLNFGWFVTQLQGRFGISRVWRAGRVWEVLIPVWLIGDRRFGVWPVTLKDDLFPVMPSLLILCLVNFWGWRYTVCVAARHLPHGEDTRHAHWRQGPVKKG